MNKKQGIQQAQLELGELCDGIDLSDAWVKFYGHTHGCVWKDKRDANGAPVRMRMTFIEWLRVWAESGHWHQRGNRKGCYVMARHHDLGHYKTGNVSIILSSKNAADGNLGKQHTEESKKKMIINRTNRTPVVVQGVEYPSIGAASHATGHSWRYIKKHFT